MIRRSQVECWGGGWFKEFLAHLIFGLADEFEEECCFLLSSEWNLCKVYPLYPLSSTLEGKVLVYSLISKWPCTLISLESLFQFQPRNSFRPLLGKK